MKYAFVVTNKRNSRTPFAAYIEREFQGGYVGSMLQDAQKTARRMGGKLLISRTGHTVECERSEQDLQSNWNASAIVGINNTIIETV